MSFKTTYCTDGRTFGQPERAKGDTKANQNTDKCRQTNKKWSETIIQEQAERHGHGETYQKMHRQSITTRVQRDRQIYGRKDMQTDHAFLFLGDGSGTRCVRLLSNPIRLNVAPDTLCIRRCFSAQHGCNECLFERPLSSTRRFRPQNCRSLLTDPSNAPFKRTSSQNALVAPSRTTLRSPTRNPFQGCDSSTFLTLHAPPLFHWPTRDAVRFAFAYRSTIGCDISQRHDTCLRCFSARHGCKEWCSGSAYRTVARKTRSFRFCLLVRAVLRKLQRCENTESELFLDYIQTLPAIGVSTFKQIRVTNEFRFLSSRVRDLKINTERNYKKKKV